MARPSDNHLPPVQPLPKGIHACLESRPRPRNGDNLGLWLDKYLPLHPDKFELKAEQRERVLGEFFVARDLGKPAPWRSDAAREALDRLREACEHLYRPGNYREFQAEVDGRLLLDYARLSTLESSLSFHASLGVPRIAGSALKGLLRAALRPRLPPDALAELFGAPDLELPRAQQTAHRRGRLVFHDAYPAEGKFQLDLDVITPHFRDYYEGKGKVPPADWLGPKPFTFLTVVATTFRIFIGLLPTPQGRMSASDIFKTLEETLPGALALEGLGAKRSAGYGRFKNVRRLDKDPNP